MQRKRSKWAVQDDSEDDHSTVVTDSIEIYLDSPPIPKSEVKAAGGVLKYWENSPAQPGPNSRVWPWIFCRHQV